jgi:hypothetical protein
MLAQRAARCPRPRRSSSGEATRSMSCGADPARGRRHLQQRRAPLARRSCDVVSAPHAGGRAGRRAGGADAFELPIAVACRTSGDRRKRAMALACRWARACNRSRRRQGHYEWLAPLAATVDAWTTEYLHVLRSAEAGDHPVVAWTKEARLRHCVAALGPVEGARSSPTMPCGARAYPVRADGRVLSRFGASSSSRHERIGKATWPLSR